MTSGLLGERTEYFAEGNYLTFEHAFTDAGAEAARRRAAEYCGHSKKVAVRTSGTCTLKTCTAHYQCMDKADAPAFQSGDPKK